MKKIYSYFSIEIHAFLTLVLTTIFMCTPFFVVEQALITNFSGNVFRTEYALYETSFLFPIALLVGFIGVVLMFAFTKTNKLPQQAAYSVYCLYLLTIFMLTTFKIATMISDYSSSTYTARFGIGWYLTLITIIYSIITCINLWTENCIYLDKCTAAKYIK
ncbi:MAG: hypothetical protein PHX51_04935 [Clostridia bacterium]|nr:hypothetical protein [Clostridia bacterium]